MTSFSSKQAEWKSDYPKVNQVARTWSQNKRCKLYNLNVWWLRTLTIEMFSCFSDGQASLLVQCRKGLTNTHFCDSCFCSCFLPGKSIHASAEVHSSFCLVPSGLLSGVHMCRLYTFMALTHFVFIFLGGFNFQNVTLISFPNISKYFLKSAVDNSIPVKYSQ